jgi:2-C-methyl-D-erythritol 4-phosphate cytidylyltransferase
MKTIAIVPAAGSGRRLGLKTKKPFVLLGGKPLVTYALKTLDSCKDIDGIIVAAERSCVGRFKRLVKKIGFKKIVAVVPGGATRSRSVKRCLDRIPPSYDTVLIHDGARPFVDDKIVRGSIGLARRYGACVVAVPENDTVKFSDGRGLLVSKTLERRRVFRAQTPQVFRRWIIEKAYASGALSAATDDASLAEEIGAKVRILCGSNRNIKVTTKEDLKFAGLLIKKH